MSWHQLAMCRPPPNLHISRNLQAPSQMPCMMETSMQKKRSAAEAEPINLGCTGTESIQTNANRVFFISAPLCLFGWLVVFVCVCLLVFWHLGAYFGVVVALWRACGVFVILWVTLGLHCGTLGLQFATLGVHFPVFLMLLGTSGGH